jgi:hypothetical protein
LTLDAWPNEEIEAVAVADGCVAISRKNGGFSGTSVDTARVPNLSVLLRLLDLRLRSAQVWRSQAFSTLLQPGFQSEKPGFW